MGPLVWGLGTSWTMPGLASEGRAHQKRNIWEEGREGGKVSFGEHGGSPQGNPQQMQRIMKKYNAA